MNTTEVPDYSNIAIIIQDEVNMQGMSAGNVTHVDIGNGLFTNTPPLSTIIGNGLDITYIISVC